MSPASLLSSAQCSSPVKVTQRAASLLDGSGPRITELRARLQQIAPFFRTALIHGEAGAGKHRTAQELHRLCCAARPLVCAVSAAIASHESDSRVEWTRLFRAAQGGVLYLDEIGGMPMAAQSALYKLLQTPQGRGTCDRDRVRVIAATCSDPKLLVATGRLHRDLYNILSAVPIRVPSLRERPEDITDLVDVLRREELGAEADLPSLSPACLTWLKASAWQGNVAELRSTLQTESLEAMQAQAASRTAPDPETDSGCGPLRLQDLIDAHVGKVLAICGGNKLKTAETLGVSRSTLYRMLEEMGGASGSLRP